MTALLSRLKETEENIEFSRKYTKAMESFGKKAIKTGKTKERTCEVCGSGESSEVFEAPVYTFVKCKSCGFVYARKVMNDDALEDFYVNNEIYQTLWGKELERLKRKKDTPEYTKNIQRILDLGAGNESALDLGCGQGKFLYEIKSHYRRAIGVELNKEQAQNASSIFEVEVLEEPLEKLDFESDSFDLVAMNQVIEHISSLDSLMKEIVRILRPGGVLYITCPNFDSLSMQVFRERHAHVNSHVHVNLFTPETLKKLARRYNLRDGFRHTYMLDITAIDLATFYLFKQNFLHRLNYNKLVYPASWVVDRTLSKIIDLSRDKLLFGRGAYIEAAFRK